MLSIRTVKYVFTWFEIAIILLALPGFDTERGSAEILAAVTFLAWLVECVSKLLFLRDIDRWDVSIVCKTAVKCPNRI